MVHAQLNDTPERPSPIRALPDLALEPLVLDLLDRDPDLRPGCAEVRAVLQRVLRKLRR